MKLKLLLTLAGVLLSYVTHAADNAIVLKAKDGQTVKIESELAQQSGLLDDMLNSPEFIELHNQKDEDGNPLLEFKGLEVALCKQLLKFAQKHPIEFPEKPTLQERKTYQDDITKIVAEFKKFKELYFGKMPYTEIFKIAQFFDIPVIKQTLGQLRLSPALDLKALEQHAYISSSSKLPIDSEFQYWVALQLGRRKDLDIERYFADEMGPQDESPYFKGVSIQDCIDHEVNIEIGPRRQELNLSNMALCSLEGLEEILHKNRSYGYPIKKLILRNNKFTTIPTATRSMGMVELLDLRNNAIKAFPNRISGWNKLDTLDLTFNEIEAIPEEMVGLENIRSLTLYGNKIKQIPTSVKGLDSLVVLSLNYNKITDVRENIIGLPSLQHLILVGNPIRQSDHNKRKMDLLEQNAIDRKKPRKEGDS